MRVSRNNLQRSVIGRIALAGVVLAVLSSSRVLAAEGAGTVAGAGVAGANGAAGNVVAGIVKRIKGKAAIERAGKIIPVALGTAVEVGDVVTTDAAGGVGIVLNDNSLVSLGPKSRYTLERFAFDTKTHAGTFASSLARGSLAMVSGKLAKQSPDAVLVRTPSTLLGVRGTEFIVDAPGG